MNRKIHNAAGEIIYSIVHDLDADTTTVVDHGVETVTSPIDPAVRAEMETTIALNDRRLRLDQAAATLRQWAEDARGVNVAPMNVSQHKNVTQTLVDRLGVFFDRFADLLDDR